MIADDYQKIWYTYLPHGMLWPEQEGDAPYWDMYAEAQAQEWARVDAAALELVKEVIPDGVDYPDDLLDYWERVADLDPSDLTETERRENLIAKLRGSGSPTKTRFSEQIDPVTTSNLIIDGCQIVDSSATWSGIGSGTIDTGVETGPDGGVTADLITMPAVSDGAGIAILRMADYEALSVTFFARAVTLTDFSVDITLVGRDGANKHTDTFTFTNSWRRYSFDVENIGTGGSNPSLQIELDSGTDEVLAVDNVEAGFKRKYFPQLVAGGLCGSPSAPGWEFVWGVEYGEDLVDRDVGGNPDWTLDTGSGSISDNSVLDPVSRNWHGDTLTHTASALFKSECNSIPSTVQSVRASLWFRVNPAGAVVVAYIKRSGYYNFLYASTPNALEWIKVEDIVSLGTGAVIPKFHVFADDGVDVVTAHVRVSSVNNILEETIENGAPLHTQPVFLSYEELSGIEE